MDWFFSGLGTLLVGVLIGSGSCFMFKLVQKRQTKQKQVAGDRSVQIQVGGDQTSR